MTIIVSIVCITWLLSVVAVCKSLETYAMVRWGAQVYAQSQKKCSPTSYHDRENWLEGSEE